jgi:hypothetical protein
MEPRQPEHVREDFVAVCGGAHSSFLCFRITMKAMRKPKPKQSAPKAPAMTNSNSYSLRPDIPRSTFTMIARPGKTIFG